MSLDSNRHVRLSVQLRMLKEFIENPNFSKQRGGYAAIRTIENLISAIFHYAVNLIQKSAEKSVESISTGVAKAIVPLLVIAVASSSGIAAPAAIIGSSWVQQAGALAESIIARVTAK